MHGGPSGFQNARVTRAIVAAAAVFTVFVGLRDRSSSVGLSYQDIFQNFNFWRLISSIFAFSSTPELMFGLYLLYYFRVFERQIGSNKYSVFTLFSVIVASLFVILALALLKDPSLTILSPGPYGLIFASFVPFYFDIPVSTLFHIFGLRFSNKAFVYLAGFQLLLSSWKRTLLPGVCGILAGSLYRLNILGIRRLKFPRIVTGLFSWFSHSSSGRTMPRPSGMSTLRNLTSHTDRQIEVPRNYPSTRPASTVEPSEDSIATLVSMGFDRNSARQALVRSQNDMNMATNMLLEAQSH